MELRATSAGPFATNCYIFSHEGKAFVVDPGMGAARWVKEQLESIDVELEAIVLTHGHIDHTRDVAELLDTYAVPVFLHHDDYFMVTNPGEGVSRQTAIMFAAEQMRPLSDESELHDLGQQQQLTLAGVPFTVLHAPGHSPGSVLLVAAEHGFCFSGDVLFKGSIGRTDLPGSDPAAMERSLRDVVLALDDGLQVFCGHGEPTTMRAERRTNPFLQAL